VLARLFHQGNYFNGITAFTERDVLLEAPYDPGLIQLQDYDVWVRLAKRYDVRIMPDSIIRYRIRGGSGNLSSPTPDRLVRLQNETYLILRRFLDDLPAELFREAFANELIRPDFVDGAEYACEQAFLFCRSAAPLGRLIGLERLQALLNNPVSAEVLGRQYAFTNHQFFDLLRSVNVAETYDGDYSTLFMDTGVGWSIEEKVGQRVSSTGRNYRLTFQLPAGKRLRALRWDPVELRTCRVRIDAIEQVDHAGRTRQVGLADVQSNGERLADGTVSFQTADPMFWWSVPDDISTVTLHGVWEFDDSLQTTLKQSQYVHDLRRQIADTRQEMHRVHASPYWRLTKPLRLVGAAARRLKAG
jgi:hypothetical protein